MSLRLPREWSAYFPAAILLVDRPEILHLFAASGAIVQARLAVATLDGEPRAVVRWLCAGLRRGYRAPIGYLHDAATIRYPFSAEPLKTCLESLGRDEKLVYLDLGLPPRGLDPRELPFESSLERPIFELEAAPPAAIVAWATRQLMAAIPRDPWLAPLTAKRRGR